MLVQGFRQYKDGDSNGSLGNPNDTRLNIHVAQYFKWSHFGSLIQFNWIQYVNRQILLGRDSMPNLVGEYSTSKPYE